MVVVLGTEFTSERGAANATKDILRTYLGTDLLNVDTFVTKEIGVVEVKDGTDIQRVAVPSLLQSVYPSIREVRFEEV